MPARIINLTRRLGAAGVPARIAWQNPDGLIASLWLGVASGADADLAAFELAIVDADGVAITVEMLPDVAAINNGSAFVPALAIMGLGHRWFPMRRWIRTHEEWVWTWRTTGGALEPILLLEHIAAAPPEGKGPSWDEYLAELDGRADALSGALAPAYGAPPAPGGR